MMGNEIALLEIENELETLLDPELLKDFITEEIMQANDQWVSTITSFAFVAIERFIAHCKDNNINPLEMQFREIQDFAETCLQKELKQEIKNQTIGLK